MMIIFFLLSSFFVLACLKYSPIQSRLCTLAAYLAVRDKVPSTIISFNYGYTWFCVLVLVPLFPRDHEFYIITKSFSLFTYSTILLVEVKKPLRSCSICLCFVHSFWLYYLIKLHKTHTLRHSIHYVHCCLPFFLRIKAKIKTL